jgi:hypothetical protein
MQQQQQYSGTRSDQGRGSQMGQIEISEEIGHLPACVYGVDAQSSSQDTGHQFSVLTGWFHFISLLYL